MKAILILAFTVGLGACATFNDMFTSEWELFKIEYKKKYATKQEEKRHFHYFLRNKMNIAQHNIKYEQNLVSYKLEINHFGDQDFQFPHPVGYLNCYKPHLSGTSTLNHHDFSEISNLKLPKFVDWRKKGAVTEVKDQEYCGSCYAFSTTGALEAQYYLKTGKLIQLSEQNVIDCSLSSGNLGCDGGKMELAFEYIKRNSGIDSENSYPYKGEVGKCKYNSSSAPTTDEGVVVITSGDENKLKAAVANIGPAAVGINGDNFDFLFYKSGIYDWPNCNCTELNHAGLVVGYGTTKDKKDYWIIKNSFGPKWGLGGYIYLSRNNGNLCGIASAASIPMI